MALNEQARAALEKTAGAPPVEGSTVHDARQAFLGHLGFQSEPLPTRIEHLFVPGPTADLPARVYYPSGDGPFPAIVFLHGSGFVIGNLDVYDVPLRRLAHATGHAVFAVNYQKAPEHPFPIPLDDCYAATAWFFHHARQLGVDPERIGIAGDSAGGTLAAAVTLKAREAGPGLAFQILVYPPLDTDFNTESYADNAVGHGLRRDAMRWFWSHYLNGQEPTELAAPLRASLDGLPPAFVGLAEHDPVRSDGERYAEKLAAAGVPVHVRHFDGTIHGFVIMDGLLDELGVLLEEITSWLGEL
ncbi:acetyl esterase [Saccharothrix tamanrassetensis]|uniref:Acetyl esterase n=1 Tax=Saccharothrix tamanrassetensis TaxID=1051531 RepID=A0A841CVK2_9PSEU|nr:alpha/beta hydrolase [Saccharothrix tamanrassetensis]MBB5959985.1 acetyl esterase [Saccharothrix tamanrassetensis]